MGLIEKAVFYLVIILAGILFLKLDSRISILNRLLIAVVVIIILFLLFLFLSAIITIVLAVIVLVLIFGFLERRKLGISKWFKK